MRISARKLIHRTCGYRPPGASSDGAWNRRVRIIISAAKMPAHAATGTATVMTRSRSESRRSVTTKIRAAAIASTRIALTKGRDCGAPAPRAPAGRSRRSRSSARRPRAVRGRRREQRRRIPGGSSPAIAASGLVVRPFASSGRMPRAWRPRRSARTAAGSRRRWPTASMIRRSSPGAGSAPDRNWSAPRPARRR